MKKLTIILALFLLVVPLATAITIHEPQSNFNYYEPLIDVNITWDSPLLNNCSIQINGQHNLTTDCVSSFVVDIPYNNGSTTLLFRDGDGGTQSVSFNLIDEFNPYKQWVIVGTILLPFLFCILLWWLAFKLQNAHAPFKLFLNLMGIVFLWSSINALTISLRTFVHSDKLLEVVNTFNFIWGWVFWITLLYVSIHFFKSLIEYMGGFVNK